MKSLNMRQTRFLFLAPLALLVAVGCQTTQPKDFASRFADPVMEMHRFYNWQDHDAFQTDITVEFGGETRIEGTMIVETKSARTRIEMDDGTVAVYDSEKAWVSPPDAEFERARFHLLTWSYFLAAPFKLRDPGTQLHPMPNMEVMGEEHEVAQLTFEEGTGDTPDDWYVVYKDKDTDHLRAMAYIVTYGTPRKEAEKEPHAVLYDDLVHQSGVTLPSLWTFYDWSPEKGLHGEPLGTVMLSNMKFIDPEPGLLMMPANAREDELPPMNR